MARDWTNEAGTLSALEARLMELAPDNVSRMPISSAKQLDENENWAWTVDLHIRIPHVTEYEVTGAGKTYAGALRRALLGLNNEPNIRRMAARSNLRFGVAV